MVDDIVLPTGQAEVWKPAHHAIICQQRMDGDNPAGGYRRRSEGAISSAAVG
jgi:hypothetical protein